MHASEVTPEAVERANELYWTSDRSVNQIADDLELSKGALYGILEPEPSGLGCPVCGEEVAFPNRTAKDRRKLDCPKCSWEGGVDETTTYVPRGEGRRDGSDRHRHGADDESGREEPRGVMGRDTPLDGDLPAPVGRPPHDVARMRTIAGGALLGAAAGLAVVFWARRR